MVNFPRRPFDPGIVNTTTGLRLCEGCRREGTWPHECERVKCVCMVELRCLGHRDPQAKPEGWR